MRLNLGCGGTPKDGYINIDARPLPGVNIVRDVLRGLPFCDGVVDEVFSENFLEHVPQPEVIWLMNEIWRVVKPGGMGRHIVPQAGTVCMFQDPTHLSQWHPETFGYFQKDHHHNRYYGDAIRPWIIEKCGEISINRVLEVIMRKP